MPKLTMLSFGGGQDSTALLLKYFHDPQFKKEYAPNDFIVVMSDTGDEHDETYQHVIRMQDRCLKRKIPFFFLRPHMGFHYEKWPGLRQFYRRCNTIGSKAFPKTCTDKLKITPIYKFLAKYVYSTYDFETTGRKYQGKQPFVDFMKKYGKIRVIIGIAAGEETRVADPSPYKSIRLSIERSYPLIELGMDRAACQKYITSIPRTVLPMPSNCMLCPFVSKQELLWLFRFRTKDYNEWVSLEAAKLKANKHMGKKNLGVWGRKTLPEVLKEAQTKHGHMTDEALWEHKMSHGHCVKSKY